MPRVKTIAYALYEAERARADRWEAEYRQLVERVLLAKPKAPRPPELSDEATVRHAEAGALVNALVSPETADAFVDGLVRDLTAHGIAEPDARKEAQRIRREVVALHMQPAE